MEAIRVADTAALGEALDAADAALRRVRTIIEAGAGSELRRVHTFTQPMDNHVATIVLESAGWAPDDWCTALEFGREARRALTSAVYEEHIAGDVRTCVDLADEAATAADAEAAADPPAGANGEPAQATG